MFVENTGCQEIYLAVLNICKPKLPLFERRNFAPPKARIIIPTFHHLIFQTMERSKQIQVGLLSLLAVLLLANLFGGGFKNWFGHSADSKIRESASSAMMAHPNAGTLTAAAPPSGSGNIPGTNVNSTVSSLPTTTIQYENEKFNFGTIPEGEVVKHVYKFKNTGSEPLIISNAKGSCGCTVPTWPKEPVPPGGTGEIKVEFNSKGKPGPQNKRVTVTANTTPTETYLEIAGEVKGKEQPAAKGTQPNQ